MKWSERHVCQVEESLGAGPATKLGVPLELTNLVRGFVEHVAGASAHPAAAAPAVTKTGRDRLRARSSA